jgi:hypothetical protein
MHLPPSMVALHAAVCDCGHVIIKVVMRKKKNRISEVSLYFKIIIKYYTTTTRHPSGIQPGVRGNILRDT